VNNTDEHWSINTNILVFYFLFSLFLRGELGEERKKKKLKGSKEEKKMMET